MTNAFPVDPIAIIGMRGRFPDATNLDQFWKNLTNGVESLKPFTEEEVKAAGIDESWLNIPGYVRAGSVLDDVEMFDALFFGFSARDAEIIDPQQRLFLETAWESLESAGYDPDSYPGDIAVFAGTEQSTYLYQLMRNPERLTYADPTILQIGNDKDYLATQVSYKLNLRGPSMTIQTACSTSLVAVAVACQSLLSGQCDIALAGGVSIGVPQKRGYWYQPGGIHSPDGHCRTFDAAGQGTVVGNGIGVVVLKRLCDAQADGDQIHALIRGAAINNDGSAKVGFSAPSVEGQVRAIRMAQTMAGIEPETIGYIEAHGTATLLGDPIEFTALNDVFKSSSGKRGWCAIGSLKSNVGHLASAAGVAGLIKTVLLLKNKTLVPSLNFKTPNPQIDFASSPFFLNTEVRPWEANGSPRRAGISSFGVGGTNAHVVVEEASPEVPSGPSRRLQMVLISAKSASALETATTHLGEHLRLHPQLNLADVAFTTQVGRKAFGHRRLLRCEDLDTAAAATALETRDLSRLSSATPSSFDRPIVLMFPGQGAQYVNMALDLYRGESEFQSELDSCCELLEPHLGCDLRGILYPPEGREEAATARLTCTSFTQPALFAIEFALARLWMKWGLRPKAMIGHSIGEYVAACLSGVFTLPDAAKLIAARGRLMEQMPSGGMLAVPLSESEAALLGQGCLDLAAVNAPYMSVLSGQHEAIDRVATQLSERGLQVRKLHTSHAFHSAMMDPILEPFETLVESVERKSPRIPFISNLTGKWITADQARDPAYWSQHLRSTVQFSAGLKELFKLPAAVFLEAGPGRTLQTFVRQQPGQGADQLLVSSLRSLQELQSDEAFLMNTIGQLWLNGVKVDWKAFSGNERRQRIELPTYPFERQKYWIGASDKPLGANGSTDAQERDISEWFYTPAWKREMPTRRPKVGATSSRWLIFRDAVGLGALMATRLRENGSQVILVAPANEFSKMSETEYAVRPDKLVDYCELLKQIDEPPEFIAHLWSVTPGPVSAPEDFETCQKHGFFSLVYLTQALEKQHVTDPVQIGFVSNHVHSVLGDEPLCPAKATALGPCKVLPQEYLSVRCRAIDVALDVDHGLLAERLVRELTLEPFQAVVAYRQGQGRWVQSYDLTKFKAGPTPAILRESGVFLITGGLGNIGLALAESLARSVKAKLILTGRSSFPEREHWEQWQTMQGEDDPTSRKIRRLQQIEKLGGRVLVLSADSSDREQMKAVIGQAEEQFGPIHGVIHGAGNTGSDGFVPFNQVDARVAEGQWQPKAHGIVILEELLSGKPLDFVVLFASISGVLGGLGLLAYSSANLFLDSFAALQNRSGDTPWISVNWDAWQFPADENGFKKTVPNWREYILPSEGVEAFSRILVRAPGQIVVSATKLDERLMKWVNLESLQESPGAAKPASVHPRPNLSTQFVPPKTPVEVKVTAVWENLLGIAPIGVHDKFFELGGHSLLAIQLISKIREIFRVEVSPQRLFEAPTVAQFAAAIEADLNAAKEEEQLTEEERMAKLLELVEGLSDQEVAELLADPVRLAKRMAAHG